MKLLDHILLAEDFSKSSENVVTSAIELAKTLHAKIIPIHVLPDDIMNEKAKSLLETVTRENLEKTVKKIKENRIETGKPILEFGSAHDMVVRTASKIGTNLIVIGSGASQEHERYPLGSTAKRIVQKSEKPVFVVKENTSFNIRKILCPIDFSDTSKRALQNAITIAHRFRADLMILSVCELESSSWLLLQEEKDLENRLRLEEHKEKFDSFLKEFNLTDLNWNSKISSGTPSKEILNNISNEKIDLLVMGTVGRTGLNRMIIGSVTEKVIRELPSSFLTLKSENLVSLQLDRNIQDIESLYKTADQLVKDGFFEEAIEQLKSCLNINNMHVPAYYGIAKVYDKLDDHKNAGIYRDKGREIKEKIWYLKIEEEVRHLKKGT